MKVYTEVNYEIKNDVLVEQSSKSFDYSGEVSLCKGGGDVVKKVLPKRMHADVDKVTAAGDMNVNQMAKDEFGRAQDWRADREFKKQAAGAQGKIDTAMGRDDDSEGVDAPVLAAEEIDPEAALTAQNTKRKELQGRGAANLTAGQSATMLTS